MEQTVAGQPRKVADWFERIELSSHGKKYKATENYRQKTTKELDYNAGNVIVIVKKEVDKEVIGKDGQKTLKKGAWMGYREADGAGLNRIVRNHHTLEEIIEDSDEHNAPPVDLGEDGAVSEQEESDDESSDDDGFNWIALLLGIIAVSFFFISKLHRIGIKLYKNVLIETR